MSFTPWYTSDQLIDAVKRKINFPTYQSTFTDEEILAFANEEMMIAQVPSIMTYHEEYLVYSKTVPILANKGRYAIPERAIGLKLRDIFFSDTSGNLSDMTRISPDDKAFFQVASDNNGIRRFYLENNDVVIFPVPTTSSIGSLVMTYFLRPNQLVKNNRAAIISNFCNLVTIDNDNIQAGDTISIADQTFTAVVSSPSINEFEIGVNSVATATNLSTAINNNGIVVSTNGSPSTSTVTAIHSTLSYTFTTNNPLAFVINQKQCIRFSSIPTHIVSGSSVDILQTKPGHKLHRMDVIIPNNSVSNNDIFFNQNDIPEELVVGDYICQSNEAIIPQIPTDLHNVLAERTCVRILSAIGDIEGVQVSTIKLQEMEVRQGTLIDARVTGAPQKILAKNSLLRNFRRGIYRGR